MSLHPLATDASETMTRYRRTNQYLTIDGETKPLFEWAEMSKEWGVSRQLIQDRLARGKSHEDAVMDPPRKYAKRAVRPQAEDQRAT